MKSINQFWQNLLRIFNGTQVTIKLLLELNAKYFFAITVPVLNPDGYQYHYSQTHSGPQDWSPTPLEQDVLGGVDANRWIGGWKKNRREIKTRNGTKCVGVDLRNNFRKGFGKNDNYRWMPPPFVPTFLPNGLSDSYPFRPHDPNDPCSPHYRGRRPFSEPETAALRNYLFRKMRRGMKR